MLISDKHKVVFVHIPKTGGSVIRRLMIRSDRNCYEYKAHHAPITPRDAEKMTGYFKFAVVRNSYDLCASGFRFMTEKIGTTKPDGEIVSISERIECSFMEYLVDQVSSEEFFPRQLDYFMNDDTCLVDKVYMFDNPAGLDEEMKDFKKIISTPHNFSDLLSWRHNYFGEYSRNHYYDSNPGTKEYVEKICRADIQYFNFKYK